MTREEFIQEQKLKILEIEKERMKLLKKAVIIAKRKPTQNVAIACTRAWKLKSILIEMESLKAQQKIVASQPFREFPSGGIAYVKQDEQEAIVNRKHEVLISNTPQMQFGGPVILPGEEIN